MATLKTRGIVLGRRVYGEADRILTLLTPGLGKIVAIAKGSRRMTSKLGGHLELFYVVDWVLAEGRTWHVVTGADTAQDFPALRETLETVRQASHVAHLVNRLVPEGEAHPDIYRLVEQTLGAIRPGNSPLVLRQFEWQLLIMGGRQPELKRCCHCGGELDPNQLGLCPVRGGVLCPACQQTSVSALSEAEGVHVPASAEAVKVLRLFERAPSILAYRLNLSNETLPELERITRAFLEHALESPLRFESNQAISSPDYQSSRYQ
ncbi:DNA repair protein RecO [Candidatus Berkelbacteria bacterium]|nr:DNA repair protein RecO [Candidatus Berkelbacteria bacterium]